MPELNDIKTEWHGLLFDVRRSVRYHDRRVRFFDHIRKVISTFTLLSGSGAIITAIATAGSAYVITASVIFVTLSTVDLIFDFAGYARLHDDLKRRFINLEHDMTLADETKENIKVFTARRLIAQADEPPVRRILDLICHNEMLRAMGYDENDVDDKKEFKTLSSSQRLFAHFMDIGADKII